jgi:hypothetical protein
MILDILATMLTLPLLDIMNREEMINQGFADGDNFPAVHPFEAD